MTVSGGRLAAAFLMFLAGGMAIVATFLPLTTYGGDATLLGVATPEIEQTGWAVSGASNAWAQVAIAPTQVGLPIVGSGALLIFFALALLSTGTRGAGAAGIFAAGLLGGAAWTAWLAVDGPTTPPPSSALNIPGLNLAGITGNVFASHVGTGRWVLLAAAVLGLLSAVWGFASTRTRPYQPGYAAV